MHILYEIDTGSITYNWCLSETEIVSSVEYLHMAFKAM